MMSRIVSMMHLAAAAPAGNGPAETVRPDAWVVSLQAGVVWFGIVVIFVAMLLTVYRLTRGPHLADRVVALDTLAILLIGFVILLSLKLQTAAMIDGMLVLSLLGFAGTVAMAQFIARPHINRHSVRMPCGGAAAKAPDQQGTGTGAN